ncbi:hypothetical protein COY33_01725 [candidate division WWE3 bacterium CG_4_10_14_0_2_um_filter_42_7]|uniref:Phosphodiesterase n=2 Tax=Katanobacteria TaxID=422282 RepID=A0A2H0X8R8_UNCKA|nr:MAG: hypothetical protein COT51_03375 [candidate division WWE3 bacterium CG08_land_8_20_14_0_20_41_15]PIZ43299.1 MAG: hypothetical protein COY33_01725 [candidate division WWE3 bacterium CG_4_10_14_0_2_um_filter_42_7]
MNSKVISIGIDGGDFALVGKWLAEGKLPNLKKIADGGVFGSLKSTVPPMTSPAWPSFMTGKNPGKHGVFDFVSLEKGKQEIVNSTKIHAETIFETLSKNGKKVYVLNVPVTYPPFPINGSMISGYPCPYDDHKIAYPEELLKELKVTLGKYRANIRIPMERGKEEACFDDLKDLFLTQVKYFHHFLEKENWDFIMIVFGVSDSVSHFFWKNQEEKDPNFGNYILTIYQMIDEEIGKVVSQMKEDTTLFIMSDHGFGPLDATVNLNIFLLDEGFLKLKSGLITKIKHFLFTHGLTPAKIFRAVKKAGLKRIAWVLPRSTRDKALDSFLSYSDIDFELSTAVSLGHLGQIFILNKNAVGAVKSALLNLKHPETKEPLVEDVIEKKEICSGQFFDKSPDLHIVFKDRRYVAYPLFAGSERLVEENLPGNTGHHRDYGIFFACGNNIISGKLLEKAHIYDLAPTILSVFGLPLDPDFDGKTLDIFKNNENLGKVSTNTDKVGGLKIRDEFVGEEEKKLMKKKLLDLGYLS